MYHLPIWVKHTSVCPLKLTNTPVPASARQYWAKLKEICDKNPHLLTNAVKFCQKEEAERQKFRDVCRTMPESIREKISPAAYRTRQSRQATILKIQEMLLNPPALSTFRQKPFAYHKAKGFLQPMPITPKGFYPKRDR